MAERRKISYIFNVVDADFSPSENGNTDYEIEVKCNDYVETHMKDVVAELCEQHEEMNFSSDVGSNRNWPKRLPTWTTFLAFSIGVVAGSWFVLKFDKKGVTTGQIAKHITVAAKGVTVMVNAATAVINEWKA